MLAICIFSESGHSDIADWSLELDQGVGAVVNKLRKGLAVGAEVSVVTNGTLVTISSDV
jgi:hypothetical protein